MDDPYDYSYYAAPCKFCRMPPRRDDAKLVGQEFWICFNCLELIRSQFGIIDPVFLDRRNCARCSGRGQVVDDVFDDVSKTGEPYYRKCGPCYAKGFVLYKKSPLILLAECADE